MAKVLLTWELGGGSGHFVNLRPFVCGLEAAGHKVFAALRHLGKGPDLLGGKAVSFLQSPYKADVPRNVIPLARTFADHPAQRRFRRCRGACRPGRCLAEPDRFGSLRT